MYLQLAFLISIPDILGPEDASVTSVSYNLSFSFSMLRKMRFVLQVLDIVKVLCSSMNVPDVHYIT